MKLYDGGRAPNPRRVRVFLAEKCVEVPRLPVDMAAMEHRGGAPDVQRWHEAAAACPSARA